jgi:hypothetical protein
VRKLTQQKLNELKPTDIQRTDLIIQVPYKIQVSSTQMLLDIIEPIQDTDALFTIYDAAMYYLIDEYVEQKLSYAIAAESISHERIRISIDCRTRQGRGIDIPVKILLQEDPDEGLKLIDSAFPKGLLRAETIEGLAAEHIAELINKRIDSIAASDFKSYSDVLEATVKLPASLAFPILTRTISEAPSRSTLEMNINKVFENHSARALIVDNSDSEYAGLLLKALEQRLPMHEPGSFNFRSLEVLSDLLLQEE